MGLLWRRPAEWMGVLLRVSARHFLPAPFRCSLHGFWSLVIRPNSPPKDGCPVPKSSTWNQSSSWVQSVFYSRFVVSQSSGSTLGGLIHLLNTLQWRKSSHKERSSEPMSFHMRCTKCGSTNLDLQKDQRAFVSDGRNQVLLHCYTCGHVIYGESKIQAECNRQYAEWEARNRHAATSNPGFAQSRSGANAATNGRATVTSASSNEGSVDSSTVAEALADFPFKPGDVDPVTGLTFVFPNEPPPLDPRGRPLKPCVWPPCEKYARPRSKYCSRNCSNKNARARYSKRSN